jgi:hypothetical protein
MIIQRMIGGLICRRWNVELNRPASCLAWGALIDFAITDSAGVYLSSGLLSREYQCDRNGGCSNWL